MIWLTCITAFISLLRMIWFYFQLILQRLWKSDSIEQDPALGERILERESTSFVKLFRWQYLPTSVHTDWLASFACNWLNLELSLCIDSILDNNPWVTSVTWNDLPCAVTTLWDSTIAIYYTTACSLRSILTGWGTEYQKKRWWPEMA